MSQALSKQGRFDVRGGGIWLFSLRVSALEHYKVYEVEIAMPANYPANSAFAY